jgi:fluoroquinolone transport system permease protein
MVPVLLLAINDLKMIVRDRMLAVVFCLPFLLLVAGALAIPEISGRFIDLAPHSCLVMSFVLIQIAVLFGFVYAFLMIDERDENIMSALRVVPVSAPIFLLSRLSGASLFAFLYSILAFVILGLVKIPVLAIILISLTFALLAPVIALLIITFSGNKVDAIAVFKGVDLFVMLPLVSLFISGSWKFVFGMFPHFWTIYTFEELLLTGSLNSIAFGIGIVLQVVLLAGFLRRFLYAG